MILCLDTNALLSILNGETRAAWVADRLDEASSLRVCAPVVAELSPALSDPEGWLTELGVEIDWTLTRAVWLRVGDLHAGYVQRRKTSGGGSARRVVTDYLIGAHAEVGGHALLTLNGLDYAAFNQLTLVTP